jgi:asparagine synthase (glutamine-hydrolysing)
MFAFGIIDERSKKLLLARDRCGQKPLFYYARGGRLAFASELRGLLELPDVPRVIDPVAFEEYLAFGHTLGSRTMIEGVRKIGPGEFLRADLGTGQYRLGRYWRLDVPDVDRRPEGELVDELEGELEAAVRRHLIADVPVGVLLSGGIDSSLISAMVARVDRSVKTFSVSFPGQGRFDEAEHARTVARYLGTEHVELEIEGFGPEVLVNLAEAFSDPLADHAIIPTYLLSRRISEQVKVALGGDGGDELFGGYPHARIVDYQARLRCLPSGIRSAISRASTSLLPPGTPGRNHLIGLAKNVDWAVAHLNLYFDPTWRAKLVPGFWSTRPEEKKQESISGVDGVIQKVLVNDFRTTMTEGFLTKIDRASMWASLEIRAPFLDDNLIDFAWTKVAVDHKLNGSETKILLRRLAERCLPESIASRGKQGFTMPLDRWMGGSWGNFFEDVLLDRSQGIFERRAVERLLQYQRRGFRNGARIFALVMLVLWARQYSIELG